LLPGTDRETSSSVIIVCNTARVKVFLSLDKVQSIVAAPAAQM
jgi:hypothetical protein